MQNFLWSLLSTLGTIFMKTSLRTLHLFYKLNIDLSSACYRPPALGVILHILTLYFETLATLKNTCASQIVSIHLPKHFKSMWRNFPKPDQKLQLYSLLGVHRLFFHAYSLTAWKREGVKKQVKMCNVCRKVKIYLFFLNPLYKLCVIKR